MSQISKFKLPRESFDVIKRSAAQSPLKSIKELEWGFEII